MYFDFDDRYRDIEPVGSAINRRDGVALVDHRSLLAIIALLRWRREYLEQFLPARARAAAAAATAAAARTSRASSSCSRRSICRRCASRIASRCPTSIAARARPEKTPTLDEPAAVARGNSTERTESSPDEKMRGEGPAPQPAPPAPPVETPSIVDQRKPTWR